MAHPYQSSREHLHERERVAHITGAHEGHRDYEQTYHRARGGKVEHADEAEDKAIVKHMVKPGALKAHGGKVKAHPGKAHRAKGGRVKHGKGKTVVNVNVAPQQSQPHPMPVPVPGGPPPGAAAGPPPMPPRPPMPAPGAGPVPGPMMGPRASGGRIAGFATGGPVEPHFKEGVGMGPKGKGAAPGKKVKLGKDAIYSPAKGAMGPTSGTGTGGAVARMEMSHRAKKNYHGTPPARHTP